MDYFDILLAKKLSGGGGGGEITVEGLTVNDNGTYTAPSGKAYSPVVVNLPLGEKAITANGEYNASADDLKGYNKVTVNVAGFKVKDMPTGAISSFDDGTENPLKELKVSIVPVQSGSGDPSPSNPRPISGWNSVGVTDCGKNLFDKNNPNTVIGGISATAFSASNANNRTIYLPAKPNTTYTIQKAVGARFRVATSDVIPTDGATFSQQINQDTWSSITVTTTASDKYIWVFCCTTNVDTLTYEQILDSIQIELGSTAITYEPYNGTTYTIQLGDTYYGGVLDVTTGVLTVTHRYADMGQLAWTSFYQKMVYMSFPDTPTPSQTTDKANLICSSYKTVSRNEIGNPPWNYAGVGVDTAGRLFVANPDSSWTSVNDAKADLNGVQLVYLLATPITVQLTPTQITTLLGQNNLWADSGQIISGQYFAEL